MAGRKKQIFDGEPWLLPETSYVSLTEGITWIGYNDARHDAYFVDLMNREASENFDKWRSVDGPEWLLPHLELLEEGKTWEDVPDVSEYDLSRLRHELSSVERWLEREDRDLKSTIDEVVAEVQSDHEKSEPFHLAMELIWNAAAAKEITLQGLIIDTHSKTAAGEYSSIPFRYFLRPVIYFWGDGPHGRGQLCAKPPDTDEELLEMVTTRPDDRPDYIKVLIKRNDVVTLEKRFREEAAPARPRHGGRPEAYDWPSFHAQALKVLEDEGEPGLEPDWASLGDFERCMAKWCETKWGRTPSESTVRLRTRAALKEFRQKREAEN